METLIVRLLDKMSGVSVPQQKFVVTLFLTIVLMRGKVNFRNLSRYSALNERTYSRQYRKPFAFATYNAFLIGEAIPSEHVQIGAIDCSFVPKSGKETYGLDRFYDSRHDQPARGLEVSTLAVIDVTSNRGYTLSSRQTPSQEALERMVEQGDITPVLSTAEDVTRIDFYAAHLSQDIAHLPAEVKHLVGDGHYGKLKSVTAVRRADKHLISKFRCDANLRYLYTGAQKKRGARRKYAGKVTFDAVNGFEVVEEIEPGIHLYTAIVNSVRLKCNVRLVYVLNLRNKHKPGYALLFSTDTQLDAKSIYRFYKARFQIEFLFRDAKQFTGLADCQARCQESIHFHFNASFTALNLAKLDAQINGQQQSDAPFSMATQKRRYFNQHLLERFMAILEIDPSCLIDNPQLNELRNYGAIAA